MTHNSKIPTKKRKQPLPKKNTKRRTLKRGGDWGFNLFGSSTADLSSYDTRILKYKNQIKQLEDSIKKLQQKITDIETAKETGAKIRTEEEKLKELKKQQMAATGSWFNFFGSSTPAPATK